MALRYRADFRRVAPRLDAHRGRSRRPRESRTAPPVDRWAPLRWFERSSGRGPGSLRGLGLIGRVEGRLGLGGGVDQGLVLVMKRAARRQGGLTLDVEQVADPLE